MTSTLDQKQLIRLSDDDIETTWSTIAVMEGDDASDSDDDASDDGDDTADSDDDASDA